MPEDVGRICIGNGFVQNVYVDVLPTFQNKMTDNIDFMLYILGLYDVTKLLLDRKVQRLEKSNHKCHILRILLVCQANIEAQCKKGSTPLMLATIE